MWIDISSQMPFTQIVMLGQRTLFLCQKKKKKKKKKERERSTGTENWEPWH